MRTPKETARVAIQRYKENASIHMTYNLSQHPRGTPGYVYWSNVLKEIKGLRRKR